MQIKNPQLLESYRGKLCLVCLSLETTGHHIKTRGAGGDDCETNLMPLCFQHHREVHDKGMVEFAGKYHNVKNYLESLGWEFDQFLHKWIRQESLF